MAEFIESYADTCLHDENNLKVISESDEDVLNKIDALLDLHPPSSNLCPVRSKILKIIDSLFLTPGNTEQGGKYDIGGLNRPLPDNPVQRYYESRLEKGLKILRSINVRKGWLILQLYNMGYIIKTPKITLGLDVTRGPMCYQWKWEIKSSLVEELAATMDILCVTHYADNYYTHRPQLWYHTDHFDEGLARRMLEQGKKVIVPDGLQQYLNSDTRYIYAKHDVFHDFKDVIIFSHGGTHCYQDNPFDTPLMMYKITFPDTCKSILFFGDYDYTRDEDYPLLENTELLILHAGGISPAYDDVNPNDLGNDEDAILLAIRKYRPKVVIPGHLMELTHPVGGGREGYQIGVNVKRMLREWGLGTEVIIMLWGEAYFHLF